MRSFLLSWPLVMSTSCNSCTALATVPSWLVQITAYIVFVSRSIQGVLRMPHSILIPNKSISVALGPSLGDGFGLTGGPRLAGWLQIGLPSAALKAQMLFAIVQT